MKKFVDFLKGENRMKILIWGKGIGFSLIMKNVVWKQECEVAGIVESKKSENCFTYGNHTFSVYDPSEIESIDYDFIIISHACFEECLLVAEKNGIDLDKIIVPYSNPILSNKSDRVVQCSKCMENAVEIIGILSKQHRLTDKKKRVLLYGDDKFLFQFLSIPYEKPDVEIIGVVTTTHSIQGYIKISGKSTKIYEKQEISNLDFDMLLILDRNASSIFVELSQTIDKKKLSIPFMTGIEKNEYEISVKLEPYIYKAHWMVDTLSTLYSAGRQPQHMVYDMFSYSLFNSTEYMRLGCTSIGYGDGNDYGRIRTLELLISEIKEKNLEGAIAELGVLGGGYSKILNYYFPNKELYLYDTFEGFDKRDIEQDLRDGKFTQEWIDIFKDTSLEAVQKYVGVKENIHYRKGYFPDSILDDEKGKKFCLVSLDADLYNPTLEGLKFFYPRLENGGYLIIHEYNAISFDKGAIQDFSGVKRAVKDFETQFGKIKYVPITDRNGSLVIVK